MLNRVRLEGHVDGVSPFGYTARGVPMLSFQLCLHEGVCARGLQTEHLRVLLAAEQAELWRHALRRGTRVLVDGRLRPRARSATEVVASSVTPTLELEGLGEWRAGGAALATRPGGPPG